MTCHATVVRFTVSVFYLYLCPVMLQLSGLWCPCFTCIYVLSCYSCLAYRVCVLPVSMSCHVTVAWFIMSVFYLYLCPVMLQLSGLSCPYFTCIYDLSCYSCLVYRVRVLPVSMSCHATVVWLIVSVFCLYLCPVVLQLSGLSCLCSACIYVLSCYSCLVYRVCVLPVSMSFHAAVVWFIVSVFCLYLCHVMLQLLGLSCQCSTCIYVLSCYSCLVYRVCVLPVSMSCHVTVAWFIVSVFCLYLCPVMSQFSGLPCLCSACIDVLSCYSCLVYRVCFLPVSMSCHIAVVWFTVSVF